MIWVKNTGSDPAAFLQFSLNGNGRTWARCETALGDRRAAVPHPGTNNEWANGVIDGQTAALTAAQWAILAASLAGRPARDMYIYFCGVCGKRGL